MISWPVVRLKFAWRLSASTTGCVYAQRMPRLSVSACVTLKSSCTKSATRLCRCVHGSDWLPRPLVAT